MPITTPTEVYLMEILLNLTTPLEVDWKTVMNAVGYTSEGGTRNKFGNLKKEFLAAKEAGGLPSGKAIKIVNSAPGTPKKTPKRKAAIDEDDGEALRTPKTPKTPRTIKAKAEKKVVEENLGAEATD